MALLKQIETKTTDGFINENIQPITTDPASILSQLTDSQKQAKNVMSDLSELSQAFANSFQNIEVKVEELSGQLNDAETRHLLEKNEKLKLQSENNKINNRLNNLLDILPSGVVLLDHKGFVCDCNRVAINLLGRPLLGEAWVKVIERAFSPQADDGHQISLKNGKKIHIETTGLSPEPGQMIVLTDLTKSRELQDELSQHNKLTSMGKMIASLAHQIRTPLSAAMIYGSHISESDLKSDLERKQTKFFSENLMERLKFMDRQIHDMLQFVRGERKQKQEVNTDVFLGDLKASLETLERVTWYDTNESKNSNNIVTKKHKITKNNTNLSSFLGSSDDLIGAISNLVENGLDASDMEQHVVIKSSVQVNNHKNTLVIEVSDKGLGMTKFEKQQIFEPFYTTKNNGNGLGLAIVRGVVIEHNGTIELESAVGKGSVFKISLPLIKQKIGENYISSFSKPFIKSVSEVVVND